MSHQEARDDMVHTKSGVIPGLLLMFVLCTSALQADVRPAALFVDNMVIQQQSDAAVWGLADPGEKITVSASWGERATTVTDDTGKWSLTLQTPAAIPGSAQAYTLSFEGNNRIDVENVLVGEVWLASGQSNMDRTITTLDLGNEQIGNSELPLIREYKVPRESWFPDEDTMERWKVSSSETVGDFSATAWFFARDLYQTLNVPIGIVNSSWGAKPIEAFFSKEAQQTHAATQLSIIEMDRWFENYDAGENQKHYDASLARWKEDQAEAASNNLEFKKRKPRLITPAMRLARYPGHLYKRMVQPLQPFNIKGVIWYQGEANSHSVEAAEFYQTQLTALINNWRADWKDTKLPFYVAQLAAYRSPQVEPVEHDQFWPVTRDSMRKVTGTLPHTGLAVTIDIGDAEDIHPINKWDVGHRLALLALHNDYGHKVVSSGPLFKSFTIEGDSVLIDFDHKGTGLIAKDNTKLRGFAIAGNDGKYVWAEAKIISRSNGWKFWQKQQFVEVSSPKINAPKSVNYGWADNPDSINLYNKEGLPASPFSTD